MLRRYYGKISKLPINEFVGHDGELVVDDITGKVYVMDGVTYGGTELVGATPRFGLNPPEYPTDGALWYDPISGRTYIYYQSQWVDAAPNTTYTLPHASSSTLGGIKVGLGLAINNEGVVTANSHTPNELINGINTLTLLPDGNITTPSGMTIGSAGFIGEGYGIQGNVDQILSVSSKGIDGVSALLWAETYDEMGGLLSALSVANNGVNFITGNVSEGVPNFFAFDMDGNLSLPPNSTISSQADDLSFYAEGNVNITSKGHTFIFDTDTVGRFIMPPSGVIAGHSTAGNGLNIFVGNTITEVGNTWSFGTTGNLTLPASGSINFSNSRSILTGLATESYVTSRGYLTSANLSTYATESYVTSRGYLTSANLSTYATESYVTSRGYITSVPTASNSQLGLVKVDNSTIVINNGTISSVGSNSVVPPSSTAPISPTNGQLWYDTVSGKIFVYITDAWVDTNTSIPLAGPAPLTASSAGTPGQIAYDSSHVYICVATNTWKRSNLTTW